MAPASVSVIVPAFNEQATIERLGVRLLSQIGRVVSRVFNAVTRTSTGVRIHDFNTRAPGAATLACVVTAGETARDEVAR